MGVSVVMAAAVPVHPTEKQVMAWSYQICMVFGESNFLQHDDEHGTQHALERGSFGDIDDGWSLNIKEGVPCVWVHLHSSYYGPGYERGDWLLIHGVATWLKRVIPQSTVWYGGDCGMSINPFEDVVESCWECFVKSGTKAYYDYFKRDKKSPVTPNKCEFCGVDMEFESGSMEYARFKCDGCGKIEIYDDGVWIVEHDPVRGIYKTNS